MTEMAITTDEGSYQDYEYTGGMQSIGIPFEGIFKFEVWGAGGTNLDQSGRGGYSVGYRLCNGGETFFICVGGSKSRYNGGGWSNAGYGGGATHIATANALLRDLAGNKGAVLLVAGGGGGAGQGGGTGGTGGGLTGGNGNGASGGGQDGIGGKLTDFDLGNGAFGQGGNGSGDWANGGSQSGAGGAGGGGWYGGNGGRGYTGGGSGGGGGSGYVGGMPAFTGADGTAYAPGTLAGEGKTVNVDGYARVTFVRKNNIPVVFNGVRLTDLVFNGTRVMSLIFNGARVFMERLKRRMERSGNASLPDRRLGRFAMGTMGLPPQALPEGQCPSDSLLRFAAV